MRLPKRNELFNPEIIQEIKSRELELENLINRYRFLLFTFLLLVVNIIMFFRGVVIKSHVYIELPIIFIVYLSMLKLHFLTKKKLTIPLLKYITVLGDYLIVFGIFLVGRNHIIPLANITIDQYLLFFSIFIIIINIISALRIQLQVILFSTCVGLVLNAFAYYNWSGQVFVIVYTSVFIIVSSFFNNFIAGFIYHFYVINHKMINTLKSLENANKEIISKSNEIKTKNEELESQNDFLQQQHEQIVKQKKQITSSIEYASHIQDALLDTTDEILAVAPDNFIVYKPKDIVSGDFYWFKKVEVFTKEYHVFAAVDCTGHGVPGAFMSMLGASFLNVIVTEFYTELNAADILNRMREEVKKHLHQTEGAKMIKDGMDMALCAIDYEDMKLQFAGANNPLFIIRYVNGSYIPEVEEIEPDKMPIGVHIKEKPSFTKHTIPINKGDLLYIFSDGIIDQFGGEKGDKFKKKRFKELLLQISNLPLQEQKLKIEQEFMLWKGDKYYQVDDVTVVGVRV